VPITLGPRSIEKYLLDELCNKLGLETKIINCVKLIFVHEMKRHRCPKEKYLSIHVNTHYNFPEVFKNYLKRCILKGA